MKSRLIDINGNPIEYDLLQDELAAPSLTGIRQPWHGSVIRHLTPTRLANILDAAENGDAYEYLTLATEIEDRADLHYASVLGTRKLAITGLDIKVDAATDDAIDIKLADFVREQVPHLKDLVSDLVDALGKGYSVSEILWDRSGKTWVPEEYKHRDPRFFKFDLETGQQLRLIDNADMVNGIALAPYKFIVHTPRIKTGLPIRGGLARLAAVAYMCKAWTWRDWMAFADVFGMPLRVGKYGPNTQPADLQKLVSAVANLGSDAAAVIPESMRIEFQQAAQTAGAGDFFQGLADWWDKQISKGILGQTMTADNGSSMAQAKVHNEVRLDILSADAGTLSATLNKQLIKPLIDLNFGVQKHYPQLTIVVPQPEDMALLITALEKLVPLGLQVEQSVIRDKLGLPDPAPDAVLLQAPHITAFNTAINSSASAINNAPVNAVPNDPQMHLDAANDILNPSLPESWLPAIMQVLRQSGEQAALHALADLYPQLDDDALIEQLTNVIFVSNLWGRLAVQHHD